MSLPEVNKLIEISLQNNLSIKTIARNIAYQKYTAEVANSAFKPVIDFELSSKATPKKEDLIANKEVLKTAGLSFSYNLFNRNKDKIEFLRNVSLIRELMYSLEEEKRKT